MKASSTPKKGIFYGWYIVGSSWLMVFLIGSAAVSVFFKPMLDEFGWDRATLSSVQSVALILYTFASPVVGRYIDKYGPKTMLYVCMATQVLCRLANGLATNIFHLYIGRFLYGVGPQSETQVLVNRWFVKKRGTAMGFVASAYPLGTMILAPLSSYLIILWGWRQTYLFWAAITLVVSLPLILIIKNTPGDKGLKPDGAADDEPEAGVSKENRGVLKGAKVQTGIKLQAAMKTAPFWRLASTQLICGVGCGFMMTHTVIFAIDLGFSDVIAAFFLSLQAAASVGGVLITGYMSDRIARKNTLVLTHVVRSVSFITMIIFLLMPGRPEWMLFAAMALFGFGWYTTAPLAAGLVADLFGGISMGTLIGAISGAHMMGMAIGAFAGGAVYDATHSYLRFIVAQAPLELIAALLAFTLKRGYGKSGKVDMLSHGDCCR